MTRLMFLCAATAAVLAGCGSPGQVPDAVAVQGQVTFADGKPVKDVMLTLQPMETGHPAGMKLGADGTFSGNAVPGKYAYFFTAQEGKAAALKTIPEKYRSAHMEHTVQISAGAVQIKLN